MKAMVRPEDLKTYWYELKIKPELAVIDPNQPVGLGTALKRLFIAAAGLGIYHIGMIGCVVTAIIIAILWPFLNVGTTLGAILHYGLFYLHGIFGAILIIGCLATLAKLGDKGFIRAYGTAGLAVDTILLILIALTGLLGGLGILGLAQVGSWTYWIYLHIALVLAWLFLSYAADGAVRHAWGALRWWYNKIMGNTLGMYLAFADACGRCGNCVNYCPMYLAGVDEAPAIKLREYLRNLPHMTSPIDAKLIAEKYSTCLFCGICMAVCPYQFPYVNFFMDMLRWANQRYEEVTPFERPPLTI